MAHHPRHAPASFSLAASWRSTDPTESPWGACRWQRRSLVCGRSIPYSGKGRRTWCGTREGHALGLGAPELVRTRFPRSAERVDRLCTLHVIRQHAAAHTTLTRWLAGCACTTPVGAACLIYQKCLSSNWLLVELPSCLSRFFESEPKWSVDVLVVLTYFWFKKKKSNPHRLISFSLLWPEAMSKHCIFACIFLKIHCPRENLSQESDRIH